MAKEYLHWDEKTITDFSEKNIAEMYNHGYVFTRLGKGIMQQTRSVRIDLEKFSLTSENRRILKKVPGLMVQAKVLPLSAADYSWQLGKLAKDFYETKFGSDVMSAQKIKEMVTDAHKSNFNMLLEYSFGADKNSTDGGLKNGYTICYSNSQTFHYSFPFYDLNEAASVPKDMGLAMMTEAIQHAKKTIETSGGKNGGKYIYLGSLQRPGDTYKLQFEGLEWFDGTKWLTDIEAVKKLLSSAKM